MADILIDRKPPTSAAMEGLAAALQAKLPGKVAGVSSSHRGITIHLLPEANLDDDNAARMLVLNHDFNIETPEQVARKEKKAKEQTARERLAALDLSKLREKANDDKQFKAALLDLLQAVEDLRALVA